MFLSTRSKTYTAGALALSLCIHASPDKGELPVHETI